MSNDFILEQLGMSVEDADLINERCGDKDITVKELLHRFLCDLIDNGYSGGSDERMLISSWFFRSRF